jgi:hypothetical protein
MTAIHSRLTMEKETPSLPPANIVPVKKVKLNNTMAMENTPLRPAAGASTRENHCCLTSWNLWLVDGR